MKKEKSDPLVKRIGDLDIDQNMPMQKKLWVAQRIGRTVWGIIILMGIIGFFGAGPISKNVAKDEQESLTVEYQKFAHVYRSDTLKVKLGPGAAIGGKVHLWLDNDFLTENPVQRFSPEPISSKIENNRVIYEFDAGDSVENSSITVELKAQEPGYKTLAMGLVGGSEVEVTKFFWP